MPSPETSASNDTPLAWSDLDAENAGFEIEPGVGLTVADDVAHVHSGSRWFSWAETVAFSKWLAAKVETENDIPTE